MADIKNYSTDCERMEKNFLFLVLSRLRIRKHVLLPNFFVKLSLESVPPSLRTTTVAGQRIFPIKIIIQCAPFDSARRAGASDIDFGGVG